MLVPDPWVFTKLFGLSKGFDRVLETFENRQQIALFQVPGDDFLSISERVLCLPGLKTRGEVTVNLWSG